MTQYSKVTQGYINATVQQTYQDYQILVESISSSRRKTAATAKAIHKGVDALSNFMLNELG